MFYEDQHKLAAYLERHNDKFEVKSHGVIAAWIDPSISKASAYLDHMDIRPVLRYGLPSHLQFEIRNPDNLTEEQICNGGKYRAVVKADKADVPGTQVWTRSGWIDANPFVGATFSGTGLTYRLPAAVPWPDWEAAPHVTKDEVHTSHCCKDHGCKYGDDESCPVVTGKLKQEYPCEDCSTRPDLKDARIAELEEEIAGWRNKWDCAVEMAAQAEAKLTTSPWRRMSEVPTEEGILLMAVKGGGYKFLHTRNFELFRSQYEAWFFVPDYHAKPDPLADLLKAHGVAVTPELAAALNAWKGVEK